jgi:carbon-monoxide dehydrogenase medium subunit
VILHEFAYLKPGNKQEAFAMLQEYQPDCKVLAGGTDLLLRLKDGNVAPAAIIDCKVLGLNRIIFTNEEGLYIGAFVTLNELENNSHVNQRYAALWDAVSHMATPQVRNKATLGGNLCNAAPSADTAPPLIVYGAIATMENPWGERKIAVESLFAGPGSLVLSGNDILTGIHLPLPGEKSGAAYEKHRRTEKDLALVGVAAYLELSAAGNCKRARISLGAVAPTPVRAGNAEKFLETGNVSPETIQHAAVIAAGEAKPVDDVRASAAYRMAMIRELTVRALTKAWQRACGEGK